jgi:hypothetical protein
MRYDSLIAVIVLRNEERWTFVLECGFSFDRLMHSCSGRDLH